MFEENISGRNMCNYKAIGQHENLGVRLNVKDGISIY